MQSHNLQQESLLLATEANKLNKVLALIALIDICALISEEPPDCSAHVQCLCQTQSSRSRTGYSPLPGTQNICALGCGNKVNKAPFNTAGCSIT